MVLCMYVNSVLFIGVFVNVVIKFFVGMMD